MATKNTVNKNTQNTPFYFESRGKQNFRTNDATLLAARKLGKLPQNVSKALQDAKELAHTIEGKLLKTDADSNPIFELNSPEIVRDLGSLEVFCNEYTNNFRGFVYDKALSNANPLLALAKIALLDKAVFKASEDNAGHKTVVVSIKTYHAQIKDFLAYAKEQGKELLTADWNTHMTDLYQNIVTWRLQALYLNTTDADEKESAIDKLSSLIGGNHWTCVKDLNQLRSKSYMRGVLRSALSLIEKDSPVTGRDVAFLIDSTVLGAGRDVYSIRFAKKETMVQRAYEVIMAHQHNLDLQLSK